jgi:hypothetical protein
VPSFSLGAAPAGCVAADRDLWLVTDSAGTAVLQRFDVPAQKLTKVGDLACAPRSIALDRAGTLWGLSADGKLFTIDTKDARCAPTKMKPAQSGFAQFYMAFVLEDQRETLYASDEHTEHGDPTTSLGLGVIDTKTLRLTKLGRFDNPDPRNDLPCAIAGTGDGRLYAVCVGGEVWRAGKAERGRVPLEPVVARAEWLHPVHLRPVAFWGDALWSFSHPCDERPADARCADYGSRVVRYSLAEHRAAVAREDLGAIVTAATSSTCAPAASSSAQ